MSDSSPAHGKGSIAPKWIFMGLAAGAVLGLMANALLGPQHSTLQWIVANISEPLGQLFLRLLLMLVVPLVFASLVLGVAGIGDIRKLGRVGFKSFGFCMVISGISVGLALLLTNTIQPGKRIKPEIAQQLQERYAPDAKKEIAKVESDKAQDSVPMQLVKTLVPRNPIAAVAGDMPNMLHLMFFSLFLGIGITVVAPDKTRALTDALQALFEISTKLIQVTMWLAPLAVGCLVFTNLALFGMDLLQALGWFILTVLSGLLLHQFGVYSFFLKFLARRSPLEFFKGIRLVMLTAFSTSSSNATLPATLEASEKQLGIPREIGSFVLTVGATANQNGTALYEGVTVLFLAQLAGFDLTLIQQISVAGLAILGSIGTAGVPSGSIPFIVVVLASLGINPGLVAIIMGADRFLDMCRTVVNVTGDLTAACFVARSEGGRPSP